MSNDYKHYTTVCYSGVELLKKHSLDEYGIWKINGEDPNCDFGGSHHSPHIATLEGTLRDVIHQAVVMPQFWQWGAGGDITKLEVKKIEHTDTTKLEYDQRKAALKAAQDKFVSLRTELALVQASIEAQLPEIAKLETKLCPGCAPGGKCRTPKCKR